MSLIVQKFGGTSVANAEKIRVAARRAIRAQQNGNQVVMVVSAMGHQTDVLVDLAKQITDDPSGREMDMLLSTGEQVSVALMAMAIHSLGAEAVSLTGAQIGIRTDSSHTKARIQSISTDRMKKLLDDGKIVIAAGFQGIDEDFNITTLGRGGSDTTAVALAAVLNADACEIYTDVDGVFTTDPRLVAEARKMNRVSHDEILELASLGAGVMHSRSIEFGKKFDVPIHVCNSQSFSDEPGTVIGSDSESADRAVTGAALTKNEAEITIAGVPDHPGTSYAVFSKLAGVNVAVDMIVQNAGADGSADISFTVLEDDLPKALAAVEKGGGRAWRRDRAARRQHFESVDRGPRHGDANGRRRSDVPCARRRGHQHPGHHDERNQSLSAREARAGARGLAGSSQRIRTRPSRRRIVWLSVKNDRRRNEPTRSTSSRACSEWKTWRSKACRSMSRRHR